MKKFKSIIPIGLFVVFCLVFGGVHIAFAQEVIAVVDFESLRVDKSVGRALAEIVRTELIGTDKFIVLERGELEKVLTEQELSMSGVTDSETAVEVGKLVGAEFVLVGSISRLGNTYILNVRLIKVESGEATLGKKLEGKSEDDLSSMASQIAFSVAGVEPPPVAVPTPAEVKSAPVVESPPAEVRSAPVREIPPPVESSSGDDELVVVGIIVLAIVVVFVLYPDILDSL